uniref:Uncharacterized protein n=1 Tax=Glossina palpalis gambiensis TaxID=67801 RepID=A0A1B0AWV2_9MUSC
MKRTFKRFKVLACCTLSMIHIFSSCTTSLRARREKQSLEIFGNLRLFKTLTRKSQEHLWAFRASSYCENLNPSFNKPSDDYSISGGEGVLHERVFCCEDEI